VEDLEMSEWPRLDAANEWNHGPGDLVEQDLAKGVLLLIRAMDEQRLRAEHAEDEWEAFRTVWQLTEKTITKYIDELTDKHNELLDALERESNLRKLLRAAYLDRRTATATWYFGEEEWLDMLETKAKEEK